MSSWIFSMVKPNKNHPPLGFLIYAPVPPGATECRPWQSHAAPPELGDEHAPQEGWHDQNHLSGESETGMRPMQTWFFQVPPGQNHCFQPRISSLQKGRYERCSWHPEFELQRCSFSFQMQLSKHPQLWLINQFCLPIAPSHGCLIHQLVN
jgi:hypothetical protein